MKTFFDRCYLVLFLAIAHALVPALSETVVDVAMNEAADRQARLLKGAKREGSLVFYTSIAATNVEKIAADFEKKYGIKVNVWRAGTDKVLQRVLAETKSNRFDFDLVNMSSPEMEALHREKLLQEVKSPYFGDLIAGGVPAHKEWATTYINVWVQAYNTDKVNKDELPKSYQDLLHPRWKGRLGIESKNQEWFSTVVKEMGEEKGLKFFRDLTQANGISVRTGHSLLNNLVVSGEVPLALTVYSFMPEQAKQKGAPIDWFAIEPAIATSFSIGLSKQAPHPNAAVLFYDYMLTDAQKLLAQMQVVPGNRNVESPVKNLRIKLVDPKVVLDESEKWNKRYEEIVIKAAK